MRFIKFFGLSVITLISFVAYAQTNEVSLQEEQTTAVNESVTVTVRCPGGGVAVGGDYTATTANVTLVEEAGVDCAAGGCAGWQMQFVSETSEPFNVTAQAQCEGVDQAMIIPFGDRKAMKAFRKANPELPIFTTN